MSVDLSNPIPMPGPMAFKNNFNLISYKKHPEIKIS